jgi:hypothetical protein
MNTRANIREFSIVAGLILDDLLETHPIRKDIDPDSIMNAMGIKQHTDKLESGRMFKEMFGGTLQWLVQEDFVNSTGVSPRQRAGLTTKAMAALNAMPANLGGKSIADSISDAKADATTSEGRNKLATIVGDLIGSAAGSFAKSVGSGG